MPKTKRTYEEIMKDFEKLEKDRERLDKRYFERSEVLTTKHEELMEELENC
jgi:hypothetical protein